VAPGRTRSAWLTAEGIGAWRVTGGCVVEIAGGSCEGGKKMDMGGVLFLFFFFFLFVCVISRPFWKQLHEVREQDEGFFSVLKGESRQRFVENCEAAYMQMRLAKY
jgi:hypothetical protein